MCSCENAHDVCTKMQRFSPRFQTLLYRDDVIYDFLSYTYLRFLFSDVL